MSRRMKIERNQRASNEIDKHKRSGATPSDHDESLTPLFGNQVRFTIRTVKDLVAYMGQRRTGMRKLGP